MTPVKAVPSDVLILHRHYQTLLYQVVDKLDLERLFQLNAFMQPSDNYVQFGFPQKVAIPRNIVVIPYRQQRPNCSAVNGRPDWRDVVFQWLRAVEHVYLINEASNIINSPF